jgi:hypothetical protein
MFGSILLQARKVGGILHCLEDFDEHELAKRLSIQIHSQKVVFHASGFFTMGSNVLLSVLVSCLTYEIILIQFFFNK